MQRLLTRSIPLALVLALVPMRSALACKCMVTTVEAARADASAIFEGRVLAIREDSAEATMPVMHVKLAVVRTWKGLDKQEQIEVATNKDGAACGYEFAKDTSYLVYAQESEGKLHVNACSRTRTLAEASEDLTVLGAGATPVAVQPKSLGGDASAASARDAGATKAARKRGCSAGSNAGADVTALAPLAALALLVRRRRRSAH